MCTKKNRVQGLSFCLILLVNCSILTPPLAMSWQDDPFDPFATGDTDVQVVRPNDDDVSDITLDDSLSAGVILVIRAVRESNPTTPRELARAINTMVNIEQFGEARKYLDQLIGANLTPAQMFELSEEMGPAFLLDLRSQVELMPKGKQFAEAVIKTAREQAYAPNRINDLISELSDDNKFVRQSAFRKLRLLGAPAVRVMLEVCEDRNRRREIPFVSSALKQMGQPALFPLIGAARADGSVAQAVAAGALSNIDSGLAVDSLLRMSISKRVPNSVRKIASDAVAERGLVTEAAIKQRIFDRANAYLKGEIKIVPEVGNQTTIWNWNFANKRLVPTTTSTRDAVRIMSVDLARDLYSLEPLNSEYRQLQLLTVLEATKRVLGSNRFVLVDEVSPFIRDLNADDLGIALREAMERNLLPAAIAAAEVTGQLADASALAGANGENCTLVKAVLSGYRPLQFAAARAITEIDPQRPFPGCSYVAQFIALLANTGGNSTAIAVHPKANISQALATSIFQTGRTGLTANSSVQLFEIINSDPDVDFLVITDTIARPHYHELVQQLRSYWLSRRMPVALLCRSEESERQASRVLGGDPLTIVLPFTTNAKLVNGQLGRLSDLLPSFQVSNVQRELMSQFSLNWIAKILENEERYKFYQISRYREMIAGLLQFPGDYETKRNVLSKLGTATAQITLLNLANDENVDVDDRRLMLEGFKESVNRRGIMLRQNEIQQQYDLFNIGTQSQTEGQEILGAILDTLESRTLR